MAWHLGGIVNMDAPLAGFSVIDAADLNEVIELVAKTPCARAKGPSKFGQSCSSTTSSGEAVIKSRLVPQAHFGLIFLPSHLYPG